jgi:tRNA(Ile)-lysidine synthase
MLLEKVTTNLQTVCKLNPQDCIILGVSGGADSIALLDTLVKSGYKPVVAHFNHLLRPSAGAEADFVHQTAIQYGLKFICGIDDIAARVLETKESTEEAARNARYQFLYNQAAELKAGAVVVAHQADDQVETILMNLLRGTGLNGLTGMHFKSISAYHPLIPLVRPLLDCWREEILAYCQEQKLAFVTDESNQDTTYRRNRVRLELLPVLETYNPKIKAALLQMSNLLSADNVFLETYTGDVFEHVNLKSNPEYQEIDLISFKKLPTAIQRYLVKYILTNSFPQEKEFGALHIEKTRQVLCRELETHNLQINDSVLVRVEGSRGIFMTLEQSKNPADQWPWLTNILRIKPAPGLYTLSDKWNLILESLSKIQAGDSYLKNKNEFTTYLDAEKIKSELLVRTWQPGDRYQPLGMKGKSVKLSDFWINHSVPQRAKAHWPLIFSGKDLVWIPGFQPSEMVKVTGNTNQIIKMDVTSCAD